MSKKTWGYASKGAGSPFTDINSGMRCSLEEMTGIVLNRADYSLDVLEIPKGTDAEIRNILEYKVRSLHPSPEKTPFDWIILSKSRVLVMAVITIAPALLERYRQFGKPLVILYQLLGFPKNTVESVYVIGNIGEKFHLNDGKLQSVVIEKETSAQTDATPLITTRKPIFLFSDKKKHSLFTHRNFNLLLAFVSVISFLMFLWRDYHLTDLKLNEIKTEYGRQLTEKNRLLALDQEIQELREKVESLRGQQKGDTYLKLSAIFELMPSGAVIDDLEISEKNFRLRLRSKNPVSVIEKFHDSPYFKDVDSSGIQGIEGSDLKLFTISGEFNG